MHIHALFSFPCLLYPLGPTGYLQEREGAGPKAGVWWSLCHRAARGWWHQGPMGQTGSQHSVRALNDWPNNLLKRPEIWAHPCNGPHLLAKKTALAWNCTCTQCCGLFCTIVLNEPLNEVSHCCSNSFFHLGFMYREHSELPLVSFTCKMNEGFYCHRGKSSIQGWWNRSCASLAEERIYVIINVMQCGWVNLLSPTAPGGGADRLTFGFTERDATCVA